MKDLTGQLFGRLTVLSLAGHKRCSGNAVRRQWLCRCECGNDKLVTTYDLTSGGVRSCGCLAREVSSNDLKNRNTTHGLVRKYPRQYSVWCGIKYRCYVPTSKYYKNYGGKGVKMCDEWKLNPQSFVDWWLSQCPIPNARLDVDRIDPEGDYAPSNCQLITRNENVIRKAKYMLEVNGVTKSCAQWSRTIKRSCSFIHGIVERRGEEAAKARIIKELSHLS